MASLENSAEQELKIIDSPMQTYNIGAVVDGVLKETWVIIIAHGQKVWVDKILLVA